jgi:hypothetical protein
VQRTLFLLLTFFLLSFKASDFPLKKLHSTLSKLDKNYCRFTKVIKSGFTPQSVPFSSVVRFTGKVEILPVDKQRFLQQFGKITSRDKFFRGFAHQAQVSEGEHHYWIPIPLNFHKAFSKHLVAQQEIQVFLRYIGCFLPKEQQNLKKGTSLAPLVTLRIKSSSKKTP